MRHRLGTPRAGKRPRILIVEDDIDSWNLIQTPVREAIPDARIQGLRNPLQVESCADFVRQLLT
jgi:hypothetical protein